MKVIHSSLVLYMSGRNSGSVLYPSPSKKFSIQRNYVYPTLNANNHLKGSEYKNVANAVWPNISPGYRNDMKTYAQRFYSENKDLPNYVIPVNNSFGQFMRLMYNWRDTDPETVDLATVTAADIFALEPDFMTVQDAIDAGLLPAIENYSDLDENIDPTP